MNRKYMNVITATTIRHLVATANAKQVKQEEIVDIKKLGENEYVLIYFTDEEPK